jgi:hypothetical protein
MPARSGGREGRAGGRRTRAIGAAGHTSRATRPPGRVTVLGRRNDTVTALELTRCAVPPAAQPTVGRDAPAERSAGSEHDPGGRDAQPPPLTRTCSPLCLECDLEREPARLSEESALLRAGARLSASDTVPQSNDRESEDQNTKAVTGHEALPLEPDSLACSRSGSNDRAIVTGQTRSSPTPERRPGQRFRITTKPKRS